MSARKGQGASWLLAVALSVTGMSLTTGCGGDDEKEPPPQQRIIAPPPLPAPQPVTGTGSTNQTPPLQTQKLGN